MNVAIVVQRKPKRFGRIWGEYLIALGLEEAFRALNHDCTVSDYYDDFRHAAAMADAVIQFDPATPVKRTNGNCTLWWTSGRDNPDVLTFDKVVTASKRMSTALGVLHVQHAVDLNAYRIVESEADLASDILYIGGALVKEPHIEKEWLEPLRDYGLVIYGHLWDQTPYHDLCRGVLPLGQASAAYCSTKIAINFHTEPQRDMGFITDRAYHALACGCNVITDDTPAARAIFGRRVRYSTGGEHLVRQVLTVKTMPKALTRARRRDFISNGHTYEHRAQQFIELWGW